MAADGSWENTTRRIYMVDSTTVEPAPRAKTMPIPGTIRREGSAPTRYSFNQRQPITSPAALNPATMTKAASAPSDSHTAPL